MNRKLVLIMTLTLLVGVLNLAFNVQRAKASGTIYIRADGSIAPPDAPISTVDNVTYTLTGNVTSDADGIVVERDNIEIDGAGYTLQGTGSGRGVDLSGRTNVTVRNTQIENFYHGVRLSWSSANSIVGNSIANNIVGIGFWESSYNGIRGNNIKNNGYGIEFKGSTYNSIAENNIITNDGYGIWLVRSFNNIISGNIIANNSHGIRLEDSRYNSIKGDTLTANNFFGISFEYYSFDNNFYHNNFIHNTGQIDGYSVNVWDDGYPSGGNYWSDYIGTDSNHDGIGDSNYTIDANTNDRYPLMGMFSSFNTSIGCNVDAISNSTIDDFEYFESNDTIVMHVSNTTSNQTFGFIRICIPHALMNETYHVTIDGAEPYYVNYTLYDNGTHRWIYFSYQHSTLEIIIIPEFPSFLILPIFMIATLLAVIVYRRKHALDNSAVHPSEITNPSM